MLLSQARYANHKGYTRGYVSQLKQQGALVMQGRMVDVEATDALLATFADPGRAPVAERHAAARAAPDTGGLDGIDDARIKSGSLYQISRATREKYLALQAKDDYERNAGQLLRVDDVRDVYGNAATVIRTRLESLPDVLAPQLAAETDEVRVRALLFGHVEDMLGELHRHCLKLGAANDA